MLTWFKICILCQFYTNFMLYYGSLMFYNFLNQQYPWVHIVSVSQVIFVFLGHNKYKCRKIFDGQWCKDPKSIHPEIMDISSNRSIFA